ncbi:hypothetical protein [Sphingobium sp. B2]|nr:hypothetical protein [Sphingobium sp. B2]
MRVIELGDHLLVVGEVSALARGLDEAPLLCHRGGYHATDKIAPLPGCA